MRQKREKERESRGGGAVINNPLEGGARWQKMIQNPNPFSTCPGYESSYIPWEPRLVFHTTRVVVVSFQTWYAYARKAYLGCQ